MLLRASLQGCCPWRRLAPVEGRGKHNTAEVAQKQAQEGDGGTDAAMPISSPHVSRLRGVFACQEDRTAPGVQRFFELLAEGLPPRDRKTRRAWWCLVAQAVAASGRWARRCSIYSI